MNPKSSARSCWHGGGSIERRSGPLTHRRAMALMRFYLSEAEAQAQNGQRASACYCLSAAVELLVSLYKASAWRDAARGNHVSRVARKLT